MMFSVRLVSLDHYISKPIDELYSNEEQNVVKEWQEPVLRIFGSTADGVKSCVHVHGVYPYIYVPYRGGEKAEREALLLGAALDEALKTSFNQKRTRFVYKVTLISGIPLYGYHSKHRQFFKIYFYNPFHIRRASELLLGGAIFGQKFQPHEAHIPYALQFMMDYNIYGMSFVTFSRVKYRRDPENPDSLLGVRREDVLSEKVKKITWSRLEVDAWACDILNRVAQKAIGVNPGLQAIWEDEQNRRRMQNRSSQITLQESESRPEVKLCPTEIMFKEQLAAKLAEIRPKEPEAPVISDELLHSYPAEVPENVDFLEASAVQETVERPRLEEGIGDVSDLIDEKILTQISGSQKEKAESESEGEMEFDSVLGRNQKSEEEAELEDEEGVDMTQPLDSDEEVICGAEGNRDEPGTSSEDSFWRNMADKIFQLDGAQESSSESDAETTPSKSAPAHGVSDGPPELSSAWSSSIMSILSECSECPTPSATCPTPRTFWFDYSPDLLSQTQDGWVSNKNVAPFSDFPGKSQSECLTSSDFPVGSKEIVSGGPYDDLFTSDGGEYFPNSLLCNTESTISPPSAILTPASEVDNSDINLDSICGTFQSPLKEKRKLPLEGKFTESKIIINGKPENDQQKFLQVLKSFAGRKVPLEDSSGHLTLKQYIKDCKEIVSVDFKNLCNREMIIIEYKSQNKRSLRNKYLIKPLDKFLESWNSAERKASDRSPAKGGEEVKVVKEFDLDGEKNLRSNYVINVLEKKYSDASTVQSMSNKLTVKSMEILPEGGNSKDRCYNVNENVISRGEIKMKLIKSQREDVEENLLGGTVKRRRSEKCRRLDLKAGNEKVVKKPRGRSVGSRRNEQREEKLGKCKKWKNLAEPDTKLINEINSSFEEYFKSIVKRKNFYRKRKKNIIEKMNYDEDDEEEDEEEEDEEEAEEKEEEKEETSEDERPTEKRAGQDADAGSNRDPIKFVTRFLSTFSQMSDVPPLSITIRLGNPRASVPVKVNLRPPLSPSEKEAKYRGKKHRRKTKIENVDGAADDSSSEESASGDAKRWCRGQKKGKGHYKPLSMIVYGSPREKGAGRKRKVATGGGTGTEQEEAEPDGRKCKKSSSVQPDPSGACREKQRSWSPRGGEKEKISSRSLVMSEKNLPSVSRSGSSVDARHSEAVIPVQELDFIDDSDEERKRERLKLKRKRRSAKRSERTPKAMPRNIPQADTEAFASSDDEMVRTRERLTPRDLSSSGKRKSVETGTEDPSEPEERVKERAAPIGSSGEVSQVSPPGSPEDLKPPSWENPEPGSSCSNPGGVDDLTVPAHISPTFSPFPLSGSPLFGSAKNSPEPKSQAYGEESSASQTFKSSASFGSAEFCSLEQSTLFEPDEVCVTSAEGVNALVHISGSKTIWPKRKPPSRNDVFESLQRYDIFESEENAPFYSDPRDVRKTSETGFKVLKIQSRSGEGLRSYKCSLNVLGTEERRNRSLRGQKRMRWHLVGNRDVTLTPLIKPPSRRAVSETKEDEEDVEEKAEKPKIRIMNPTSPGQEVGSDEEMELSVTMSSFSPEVRTGSQKARSQQGEGSFAEDKVNETEPKLKKGPLDRIKGIKRLSLMRRLGESKETLARPSDPVISSSSEEGRGGSREDNSFQIRGVTLEDTFGFSQSVRNVKLTDTHQYMSMLVMELYVETRGDLRPDPERDPIRALFYAITFDNPAADQHTGIVVVGERTLSGCAVSGHTIHAVPTEKALVEKFLALVREWDPEILAGYEIEMHSWGYLVQRGFVLEFNLLLLLGRIRDEDYPRRNTSDGLLEDEYDIPRNVRHMRITGRIVLDVWRVLRHEVALTSYTFENVMYHLLHERHPVFSHERLTYYWEHPTPMFRHFVVDHYTIRILGLVRILDQLDFINRTSELSRLFGIQFYEVLSRGSQFRVESMMLRLAKPLNYVPASPSIAQRAAMRAPASLPLILEPESLFYTDPVIVLDFQSLYPSIIIAYNYCFSTCLGRVEKLGGREPFEFGCTHLQISPEELKTLENDVNISPAGIAFVKPNVRRGVLPSMLEKILETRLMVKKSMKENKEDKKLQKVLFARQLGLKLIANVTYGYTAANFSGRMPCIEVGDSVVSKGRETLHRAIQLVKNTREWGARVVYGDTDSMFVLTPGRSREEAFRIGAEIASAVTRDNPKPVKLKLEKVYQPCILQTKKRYVGYMFESPEQEKPTFEAKGIETVRRDGCPATAKILEKALRILFDTRDVSLVKKYTVRQFSKLYQGRVNIQDLVFAKEYRGRRGYRPGACVPALQLAKQWGQHDKRAEPRVKERVPYVIVNGPPGVPLIRLVRSPSDLVSDPALRINAVYYITKAIIPPMRRCFSLLGVDVASWYAEMPRKQYKTYKSISAARQKKSTISQYFAALDCAVCSKVSNAALCPECEKDPQAVTVTLKEKIRRWERCHEFLTEICRSCCRRPTQLDCSSLDCPVFFRRKEACRDVERGETLRQILIQYLSTIE